MTKEHVIVIHAVEGLTIHWTSCLFMSALHTRAPYHKSRWKRTFAGTTPCLVDDEHQGFAPTRTGVLMDSHMGCIYAVCALLGKPDRTVGTRGKKKRT